jgi:DNA-directed RNA polymerase omega subunit
MNDKIDSKFRYVLVSAQRAEQLMRGARPKVDGPVTKPTRLAMQEIDADLVQWGLGPAPEPEAEPETAETAEAN